MESLRPIKQGVGIIGKYYENDLPVIVKFINELPDDFTRFKYPTLSIISWTYDGDKNNGMLLSDINHKMIDLENALESMMNSSKLYQHAYSRTGNNLKELVYYCTSKKDFMDLLNESLATHERYPIEITFYEDAQWSELKKLIEDFAK